MKNFKRIYNKEIANKNRFTDSLKNNFNLDLFSGQINNNFIVVGSAGAGKSYLLSSFLLDEIISGTKVSIIDDGGSYSSLISLVEGKSIKVLTENDHIDKQTCFNIFTNIEISDKGLISDKNLSYLSEMILLMSGNPLDPNKYNSSIQLIEMTSYIKKAIKLSLNNFKNKTGMKDILDSLINDNNKSTTLRHLITSLYDFGNINGSYFKFFNGESNYIIDSSLVNYDISDISQNNRLKEVVYGILLNNIVDNYLNEEDDRKKIILLDEFWDSTKFNNLSFIIHKLSQLSKTKNISIGIVVQSIYDFSSSENLISVYESASHKLFLKQLNSDLVLNERIRPSKALLASFKEISTTFGNIDFIYLKNNTNNYKVKLNVTKISHWLLTQMFFDIDELNRVIQHNDISLEKARLVKGISEKDEISTKEALEKVNKIY